QTANRERSSGNGFNHRHRRTPGRSYGGLLSIRGDGQETAGWFCFSERRRRRSSSLRRNCRSHCKNGGGEEVYRFLCFKRCRGVAAFTGHVSYAQGCTSAPGLAGDRWHQGHEIRLGETQHGETIDQGPVRRPRRTMIWERPATVYYRKKLTWRIC